MRRASSRLSQRHRVGARFPEYRNEFATLSSRADEVFVLGRSTCSVPVLDGPAIWKAIARDGLIAEWRVYADNEETRRMLGLGDARRCA